MTQADELRALLARGNLGQREAARIIRISKRDMRSYCANTRDAPAIVYAALELLVGMRELSESAGALIAERDRLDGQDTLDSIDDAVDALRRSLDLKKEPQDGPTPSRGPSPGGGVET